MQVPRMDALSRMDWLGPARARAWLLILAVMTWSLAAIWVVLSRGGVDLTGKPLGTDFVSFWTAGRLLATGAAPEAPYDVQLAALAQTQAFNGADVGFTPFPYPPIFLLICAPFGALPYFAALAAWLLATGAAYLLVLRQHLADMRHRSLLLLTFPAVILNAGSGQNAFLTTALFGGGVLMLQRNPVLAGACFGALIFKPHLGILIPVALIAAGSWRTIAAAAATSLGLAGASVLAFGVQPWRSFIDYAPFMSEIITRGVLEPGKGQSVFAAAMTLGADTSVAFAVQGGWSVIAAASLFRLGRRVGAGPTLGAGLVSATLIASPYLMGYDLVLASIPLAWLFNEARRTGFLPWEKLLLLAGFTLPLISISLGVRLGVPVAPIVLTALYAGVWRRARLAPKAIGPGMSEWTTEAPAPAGA